ncbi:MAG: Nif3-like dinuclear metal center hexameric protein, partial [Fusobacteriaceae bacterium]|nr:Nif3-like dinuclear metal center hexameric protein [Fusobacteriaceae bacterium]
MKLYEIINKLEKDFPLELEEKWDNSGLILGDRNENIDSIQISLDVTDSAINQAIKSKCQLIISHHPIIFDNIKKINDSTVLGRKILKLIKNGVSIYTMHTNLDSAKEGLNEYIA